MKTQLKDGWIELFPNFLNDVESEVLFNYLLKNTPWEQGNIRLFGKPFKTPRLEAFYAEDGLHYSYSGQKLKSHPFTNELKLLKSQVEIATNHHFNSVLINLYRDGSDSNGWHADNEKELGNKPLIASLSLGTTRRFDLRHNNTKEKIELPLNSGSLLIMGGQLQHHWKHQIAKSKKIVTPRINLTFRNIVAD